MIYYRINLISFCLTDLNLNIVEIHRMYIQISTKQTPSLMTVFSSSACVPRLTEPNDLAFLYESSPSRKSAELEVV
jgi:hypothetical protein